MLGQKQREVIVKLVKLKGFSNVPMASVGRKQANAVKHSPSINNYLLLPLTILYTFTFKKSMTCKSQVQM